MDKQNDYLRNMGLAPERNITKPSVIKPATISPGDKPLDKVKRPTEKKRSRELER